jgi:mannose-6-phosphate isomerase-like protein (cupin superfamily)
MDIASRQSPLAVAADKIPLTVLVPAHLLTGGAVGARIVHGLDASLMLATRDSGYHSKPHVHDCEQLNYVVVFIGESAVHVREGDMFRVPRNVVHWSRVLGTSPCTLIEAHAPPLVGDPGFDETAVALLELHEHLPSDRRIPSDWPQGFDRDAAEARILARMPSLDA